ncbi:MAG: SDR family oxidoreductase [Clostridiales bacterium]|jgi:NAD(P)-dependent dehydrogenase (short-subunit alcohol dehydrogenase family)|nr:SDR family oxidoreductase [Clostridiales bacterium]
MGFEERVVIITGGAGAIGSAMVHSFVERGANVVIADINEDSLKRLAANVSSVKGEVLPVVVDVSSKASAEAMVEKVLDRYGRIDVLVNNAGINGSPEDRKPIHEYNDDLWRRIIDIDLTGVYYCSKPVIKHMIAQGKGCIINIASIVGLVPLRLQCAFAAAKAGVVNLTKAMAIELAEHGIRVNCIAPGSILFEGTRKLFYADPAVSEAMLSHIPMGKPGEPDDVAKLTCYLASDEAKYMTGSIVTIDGGWTSGFARNF